MLWLEKMLDTISVFLIYQSLPCLPACGQSGRMFFVHLRRMCSLLLLDGMFYISIKFNLSKVSLIFCPDNLSLHETGVLKLLLIILVMCYYQFTINISNVLLSRSVTTTPFMVVSIFLMYWGALMLGAYIYICNRYIFLDWTFDHYVVSFFVSYNSPCFKVYSVWYGYYYAGFLTIYFYHLYGIPSPIPLLSVCKPG